MTAAAAVFTLGLALVRVASFVAVLPLLGGRNLPQTVKIGLAVALAGGWCAAGLPSSPPDGDVSWGMAAAWCVAAVRETVLGGSLAFAIGLFLLPLQIAGAFVAQEMGLSMASQADPNAESAATSISQLFHTLGMLLFFALDLHHAVFRVLHASFFTRPLGSPFAFPATAAALSGVADAHAAGLLLATPVAAALFVALVALLATTRTAPQLNMFSVGLPLRLGVGLVASVVFFPEMCVLAGRAMARLTNVAAW